MIDSYSKLPLGKYLDIQEVIKNRCRDELAKQAAVLSILSDIQEEEILHLPIVEYKMMRQRMRFLESSDVNGRRVAKKYICGGYELVPVTDPKKLETCQYIDFQTFAPEMEEHLPELLSVILVPKGMRYNEGYDIEGVQQAIRSEMSTTDAMTVAAFFLLSCKKSILSSLNYSMRQARRVKDPKKRAEMTETLRSKAREVLTSVGDGLPM